MKKMLIAIMLMMCLSITGCTIGESWSETVEANGKMQIKRVYRDTNTSIYVDTETNVMYVAYHPGSGGGIAVMVDQDGKPRLWEE
jgi:outer membrane lipoprotein SlyB